MKKVTTMRIQHLLIVSLSFIAIHVDTLKADVTLFIDPHSLCAGSRNNVIPLIQNNPDEEISSLQVDIFYNIDYFTVTSAKRTPRTDRNEWFNYSSIMGGYRFSTHTHHHYQPGTGPIAYLIVDVSADCPEGDYTWTLENAIAQMPMGQYPPLVTIDGRITVTNCDACSLYVTTTEFDFGTVTVPCSTHIWVDIMNAGSSPGLIIINNEGLHYLHPDPREFMLDPGSSQRVKITYYCYRVGNCDDELTIIGCRDNITFSGKCYYARSSGILSLENPSVFQKGEENTIMLNMENSTEVSGLETYILFDTTFFDVKVVNRTERSHVLSIFLWEEIPDGIHIAMTCLGHHIDPGSGPIAEVVYTVTNCHEDQYAWDVTNSIATDPLGSVFVPEEIDGIITVFNGQRGDVDDNGTFNVLDAFWALRIVLDKLPDPTPRQLEAADCNDDGVIDVTDVIGIVNIILGLGTCPP